MSHLSIRSALETAVDGLPGIIPVVSILTSSTAGVFETATPHGLSNGLTAKIDSHVGSVPAVQGSYKVVVTTSTKFMIKDASGVAVTFSVGGTGGTVKANLTAWDNIPFDPVADVPWQRVNLLFAKPENPTFGGEHIRENGYMQVTLYYPKNKGTKAAGTRMELMRTLFKRGATFVKDGITVNIPNTPEIPFAGPDDESYASIIRIPFWADVFA